MSFWRDKHVLIIGATGFLGGWITKHLVDGGAKVTCLVRSQRPLSQLSLTDLHRRVRLIQGDAGNIAAIAGAAEGEPFAAIFHLASLADVNAALREPERAMRDSLEPTLAVLEYVRTKQPNAILIVPSSDKAYGSQPIPYRESAPLFPTHPYEIAKATQDLLAQSFGKMYGLKIGVTRCGNFFGPYDFAFERIIPYTVRQLLKGERPVLRSDGSAIRDFLYVDEAAKAHLMFAEKLSTDPSLRGEVFNFSHGVGISVLDLTRRITAMMGSSLEPEILGTAKGEISRMQVDSTKARSRLQWEPPDFSASLASTVNWYRDNLPLLKL